ncbi:DUF7601 domain-containing protein [Paenibacillus sanguinis]|uniref:DUF7601 domain-containing protein n=1 Tax=Paenibacillus sanguinis TaxID=225906 RepID=UPI00036F8B70|nr:DUF5979 domain-containing protein [Paenibacillus sanguinis]
MKPMKVKWMSGLMALLVFIGIIFPSHAAFSKNAPSVTDAVYTVTDAVYALPLDGTDKSSALTNLSASITQNGKEITVNEKISHTDPISVSISFGVPVEGDEPTPANPIKKGDTASFRLSKGFKVVAGTSIPLTFGGLPVAHVELVSDSATQEVTANIIFDGADEVFDGSTGINSVTGRFNAELQYDASGSGGDEGDHTVMILEKTYTVNVPPVEIIYTSSKSGTPDLANKRINWEVKLGATQSGNPIDLQDYTFKDELSQVGEYVANSFEVNGTKRDLDVSGSELAYTFPDNSVGEQIITFQTVIPDEKYFAGGEQRVFNRAALLDSESKVVQEPVSNVPWNNKWIEKTGSKSDEINNGVYDPANRTITWTITANQPGATLENLTITDQLPQGLEWESAKWTTGGTETSITAEPTDGKYVHPDSVVNQQVVLTIVTKVKATGPTTGITEFENAASVDWTGRTGTTPSASATVGIGYSAINKSGVIDYNNRQVKWTINVDAKGQIIPDLKVYDLLVYGSSIDLNQVSGVPAGIDAKELIPRYHQKYVDQSANTSGSANFNVIAIEQGGQRVADLLVFSNLSTADKNTMSYDSQIVNPDIYAGNKTSQVYNTAMLYSGTTLLNYATSHVSYNSHLLAKELLKREAIADPISGVNNSTKTAAEGFDYVDKSVIFRLSINADGLDFNSVKNADDEVLGQVTVTDTLPEGWEFVDINPGQPYLAFKGEKDKDNGASVNATGNAVTLQDAKITGSTATFTFATLDQPYVILVKAKPTAATLADYFNNNKTSTVVNQLKLSAANWNTGVNVEQSVSVKSTLVDKSNKVPEAGILDWTVDYNPYQLQDVGETIEDTLPAGLDLRTDAQGNLLIEGNITAREMILQPDGTLGEGTLIPLIIGTNIKYDPQSRVLTFILADTNKAYRFTYLTDITSDTGKVTNHVRLSNGNANSIEDAVEYAVSSMDAAATLQRNGWLEITKTDGNTGLAGAKFTLFSEDGSTVIRQGMTAANGKIRLKVIPDGKYVLRETAAPVGYTLDSTEHEVIVSTSDSQITTSIDGKTGTDSNLLTVTNFLTGTAGNLAIAKTVAGNAGDLSKKFEFTITFNGANGTYDYTGSGGASHGSLQSGDTISLAHGERIEIKGLPEGTAYTVTEADYSADGYITASSGTSGKIIADATQTAAFTNTRDTGSLAINKTVAGNDGDQIKKFDFTVALDGAPGTYKYTGTGGAADGTIQDGDTISLAHGEGIMITDLPKGTAYRVVEADYSAEGYTTVSSGVSGEIVADDIQTVTYVNTKDKPGSLVISKTVAGNAGNKNKKFDFKVTFDGASGRYAYTGIGGATDGTLQSGDTISLAHGESIAIQGLPKDTTYTVTEEDYTKEGYKMTSTGASGVIKTDEVQTAAFTNTKRKSSPWNPGGSTPDRPDRPEEPSKPEEPGKSNEEPGKSNEEPDHPTTPGIPVPGDPDVPHEPGETIGNTGGDHGNQEGDVTTPDAENDGQGTAAGQLEAGDSDDLEKPASPGNQAVQTGNGTPKTGESIYQGIARVGLWTSLLSLLVWSGAYYWLRLRNRKSVMK